MFQPLASTESPAFMAEVRTDSEETEELLPRRSEKRCTGRWAASVLASLGLSLVSLALALGPLGQGFHRTSKTNGFLRLALDQQELQNCFQQGMFYDKPRLLPATERTIELSAELCQERCQGVDGCAHFTFWPDGGCLLSGPESVLQAAPMKFSATITGPKYCQEAIEKATAVIEESKVETAGFHEDLPSSWDAGKFQVVDMAKQSILDIAQDAEEAAKTAAAQSALPVSAGVNGSTCAMYPACVAVGISQGDCCPNQDHVTLGCCDGFPKTAEEVKISPGT